MAQSIIACTPNKCNFLGLEHPQCSAHILGTPIKFTFFSFKKVVLTWEFKTPDSSARQQRVFEGVVNPSTNFLQFLFCEHPSFWFGSSDSNIDTVYVSLCMTIQIFFLFRNLISCLLFTWVSYTSPHCFNVVHTWHVNKKQWGWLDVQYSSVVGL